MASRKIDQNKPIFIIEHCVDCKSHQWNTRHDLAKYKGFASDLTRAIQEHVPNAIVLTNAIPKTWYEKQLYFQLVPNDNENDECFDMIPRIGAFEVSTVAFKGESSIEILLFSKLLSSIWPSCGTVAKKIGMFYSEM